jgi:hypothetical protein
MSMICEENFSVSDKVIYVCRTHSIIHPANDPRACKMASKSHTVLD